MARIQNKDAYDASIELNFKTLTVDGEVQNPTIKEEVIKEFKVPVEKEFIDSILEELISKTSTMAKVHG